jgi:hypothetical protein
MLFLLISLRPVLLVSQFINLRKNLFVNLSDYISYVYYKFYKHIHLQQRRNISNYINK